MWTPCKFIVHSKLALTKPLWLATFLQTANRLIMASAGELCSELKDLVALIAVRDAMPDDIEAKQGVVKNLVGSFCAKLRSLKLFTSQDALKVFKTLAECSPMTDAIRIPIQEAVDARLAAGAAVSKHSTTHHPQKLTSQLTNYFTQHDLTILRGERTSVSGRMQIVIDRFLRIGLQWPHEQTVKWAIAAIALSMAEASGSYPTYNSVFHMVGDFKATIDSSRKPWDFGHIVEYPTSPSELPPDVLAYAYDEGHPPVAFTWDRFAATAEHHVPLRRNSALLKKDAAHQPGMIQPAPPSDPAAGFTLWSQFQAYLQHGNSQAFHAGGFGGRPPKPRLALQNGDSADSPTTPRTPQPNDGLFGFQPHGKKMLGHTSALQAKPADEDEEDDEDLSRCTSAPAALVGRRSPAAGDAGPSPGIKSGAAASGSVVPRELQLALRTQPAALTAPDKKPTAEEYEQAAFAALSDRKVTRAALKRPAAALKRPAAAAAAPDDDGDGDEGDIIMPELTEEAKKKPRRNFQSKAYHQTKNHAQMSGLSDEDCLAAAQRAYKKAGEIYDELA